MESLNEIVQSSVERNQHMFDHKGITIELELDVNMPKSFDDSIIRRPINKALVQLNVEVEDARPRNALYKTSYENGIQKLIIYHDGNHISKDDLNQINGLLEEIADGSLVWEYNKRGNLIAGQAIKTYGGKMHLANINHDKYSVCTTVEIPKISD